MFDSLFGSALQRRGRWVLCSAALVAWFAQGAAAAGEVLVDAPTLTLGEVIASAPEELHSVDLGPAPPAGSSRVLVRAELVRMLDAAGVEAGRVSLPQVVRVRTRSERWSGERLREAALERTALVLPSGVRAVSATVRLQLVLPAGTVATRLELPAIPKRVGQAHLSATLLLEHGSAVIRRVPVALVVDVSEAAARPVLERGAVVRVYIEKSAAKVAALAEALQSGDVGDTLPFRIQATRRVVQAQVQSKHYAKVVTQ